MDSLFLELFRKLSELKISTLSLRGLQCWAGVCLCRLIHFVFPFSDCHSKYSFSLNYWDLEKHVTHMCSHSGTLAEQELTDICPGFTLLSGGRRGCWDVWGRSNLQQGSH